MKKILIAAALTLAAAISVISAGVSMNATNANACEVSDCP